MTFLPPSYLRKELLPIYPMIGILNSKIFMSFDIYKLVILSSCLSLGCVEGYGFDKKFPRYEEKYWTEEEKQKKDEL